MLILIKSKVFLNFTFYTLPVFIPQNWILVKSAQISLLQITITQIFITQTCFKMKNSNFYIQNFGSGINQSSLKKHWKCTIEVLPSFKFVNMGNQQLLRRNNKKLQPNTTLTIFNGKILFFFKNLLNKLPNKLVF